MSVRILIKISIVSILVIVLSLQITNLLAHDSYLHVVFLDVGQGDAIFVQAPNGVQVLIDTSKGSVVLRQLATVLPARDRDIDIVMVTHPDTDHIGGAPDVLQRFNVHKYIIASTTRESEITKFIDALVDPIIIEAGDFILLDPKNNIYLEILAPSERELATSDVNDRSIIARLVFNEIEFMLTGDASVSVEEDLIEHYGKYVGADVLKLGHHGSKTSTSETFLSAVNPEYTVVSAGEDNSYGHPHEEVVERLNNFGIEILETKNGNVHFYTDGLTLFRK